jgi:hypothetical protein
VQRLDQPALEIHHQQVVISDYTSVLIGHLGSYTPLFAPGKACAQKAARDFSSGREFRKAFKLF